MATERDEHQAVRLSDGRLLGFAEYGDPDGAPVLFFHGQVGSRLQGRCLDDAARRRGLRIVSPDRPGLGFSDFRPGRAIADWADDVSELMDQLGVHGHFAGVGASAGALYVLACAWKLPVRLRAAVAVSPVVPVSMTEQAGETPALPQILSRSAVWAPWTIRPVMAMLGSLSKRQPNQTVDRMADSATDADRPVFARPEIRSMLSQSMTETFRSGPRGVAHDLRLISGDWGLPFDAIPTAVVLMHGDADTELKPGEVRRLAEALPRCEVRVVPGGGHHLTLTHPDQVLDALEMQGPPIA